MNAHRAQNRKRKTSPVRSVCFSRHPAVYRVNRVNRLTRLQKSWWEEVVRYTTTVTHHHRHHHPPLKASGAPYAFVVWCFVVMYARDAVLLAADADPAGPRSIRQQRTTMQRRRPRFVIAGALGPPTVGARQSQQLSGRTRTRDRRGVMCCYIPHRLYIMVCACARGACDNAGGSGPACTRALTDTWVPRSSAPRPIARRSSIQFYSSSSVPARQKTVPTDLVFPRTIPSG